MKGLRRAWHRLLGLFAGRRRERELREELATHLEMQTASNVRAGMDPQTARREARLKFGAMPSVEEAWRDQRGVRWLEETARDLRLGLRSLARTPSFAVVAVLTLGVTIALNTAVYSVIGTVFRPLPFEDADRLVTMYNAFPGSGAERRANSMPDFFLRRDRVAGLQDVALYVVGSGETVGRGERAERVPGLRVTPSFFSTLGIEAALGRTFVEGEMDPGAERSVILTDGYWRDRFAAAPDVVGRTLEVDGRPATIVGVLPPGFRWPAHPEARLVHPMAIPHAQRSMENWGGNNDFFMVGRLAPGTTHDQLEAELATVYRNVARELLGDAGVRQLEDLGFRVVVVPAHEDLVRNVDAPLLLLAGAAGFVLLIGCVNIANLMLARSEGRLPELATRAALGASRLRLARQVLGEAAVIGVLGGILGVGLGTMLLDLLGVVALSPASNTDGPTAGAMTLDVLAGAGSGGAAVGLPRPVLAYSIVLALGTSILFGLIPVASFFRRDLTTVFAQEGRGRTVSRRGMLMRGGLVAAQVALAFLLLVGAGLLLRSFQQVMEVDPGFEPAGVLTAHTSLTAAAYPDADARRAFYDDWLREVRALPGVEAAGVTTLLPFGPTDRTTGIAPVGYTRAPGDPLPNWAIVSPGYFEALGMQILEGRGFDDRDGPGPEQPRAVVIDEWLARYYWPDRSPVGQQTIGFGVQELTVIGVVETIEQKDLTAAAADRVGAFYLPYTQFPRDDMALVVRPSDPDVRLAGSLRAALNRVDPAVPLFDVRVLDARLSETLGARRTPTVLLLGFAAVALFLAAVGTYGVLAYAVAQRTRETAIRIALGSRPADILTLVLKQGAVLGAFGLAAGAIGAFALVRTIRSMLFEVEPLDPLVLLVTGAVLGLSVILASIVPACRAMRVDPVIALTEG